MKFKTSKLSVDNGCVRCTKPCNFAGRRVDSEGSKAAKKDECGLLINPRNADKYGCNNSR